MPVLDRIWIYPIKSLDGVSVSEAQILQSGALKGDREFALFDRLGRYVNAKRTARIHQLRAQFDLASRRVSVREEGTSDWVEFGMDGDRSGLEAWLSEFFGYRVWVKQNEGAGFPDDTNYPGPTVVATKTLSTVAKWFDGVDTAQLQRRMRVNLEVGEAEAFWEDRLCVNGDRGVSFRIGDSVTLAGTNPCARCVVPTRDPVTGEQTDQFQKSFVDRRKATFPRWGNPDRYNHYYRLTTNTRLLDTSDGGTIRMGDRVELV
ncbi:MAG: MOSC N-terminal beta barrel domain-containing protein [Cyanobacteria bacterium P01_E01_bin.45]